MTTRHALSAYERSDRFLIALSLFSVALVVSVACTTDDLSLVIWLVGLGALASLASEGLRLDRLRDIGRRP